MQAKKPFPQAKPLAWSWHLGDNNAQGSSSTTKLKPINFCYPHKWSCTGQPPGFVFAHCWPYLAISVKAVILI